MAEKHYEWWQVEERKKHTLPLENLILKQLTKLSCEPCQDNVESVILLFSLIRYGEK